MPRVHLPLKETLDQQSKAPQHELDAPAADKQAPASFSWGSKPILMGLGEEAVSLSAY